METEKIELSPVEAMAMLNWKKSKVYYWIKIGKFQTVERIDGQKIVLTRADIERLRKDETDTNSSENFENSENVLNNSDNFQNQTGSNAAKNYENIQKNLNSDVLEFYQNNLNLMKQMQETAAQNYAYSLKLLTDGQNDYKTQYFELKAEQKTEQESFKISEIRMQEKIKKFEKTIIIKNAVIAFLLFLLIAGGFLFYFVSKDLIQF